MGQNNSVPPFLRLVDQQELTTNITRVMIDDTFSALYLKHFCTSLKIDK